MKSPVKAVAAAFILLSPMMAPFGVVAQNINTASGKSENSMRRADAITIAVQPGMLGSVLSSALEKGEGSGVLRLTGTADVRDFRALAGNLPAYIVDIDLSDITIVAYTYPVGSAEGKGYYPADELPAWSFFTLPLESIALPATLKGLGEGALSATRIRNLDIPQGVTYIGDYALYDSPELESVKFPASLKSLGKGALGKCISLRGADFSSTHLASVPELCFSGCTALESVRMPRLPYNVGGQAFRGTAVEHIDLSQAVSFDDYALYGMSALEEVSLSPSARFGKGVFMNDSSLQNVEGIPMVLPALFAAGCSSLDMETVATEAVEIGAWALSGGHARNITFTVADMLAEGALADIVGLEEIDVRALGASLPAADENAFAGIDTGSVRLIVTDTAEDAWRQHPVWGRFNIIPDYMVGASVVSSNVDSSEISAHFYGGTLHLSSNSSPLSSVSLYSPEGMLLASEKLEGQQADVQIPDYTGSYIVVVVKAGDEVKAMKIMIK